MDREHRGLRIMIGEKRNTLGNLITLPGITTQQAVINEEESYLGNVHYNGQDHSTLVFSPHVTHISHSSCYREESFLYVCILQWSMITPRNILLTIFLYTIWNLPLYTDNSLRISQEFLIIVLTVGTEKNEVGNYIHSELKYTNILITIIMFS